MVYDSGGLKAKSERIKNKRKIWIKWREGARYWDY